MSIQVTITGDNVATLGKLAAELAAKLNGSASTVAAPAAASTPAPKPAAAPAAAKPAAAPKPAAKPVEKPAAAPAADTGGVTLESLREQGKAAIKAGKNKEMRELLTSLGSDSITALPEEKYAELDAGLKALLGGSSEDSAL